MKFTKHCILAASTLVFSCLVSAGEINNWLSAAGEVWKNASGECWRNGSWTPATAAPGCDGAIVEQPKVAAAPEPTPAPAPAPEPAPEPVQAAPAETVVQVEKGPVVTTEPMENTAAEAPQEAPQEAAHDAHHEVEAPAPVEPLSAKVAEPEPAPVAAPAPAQPVSSKVTYAADTFFDFDKSVLKPVAKAKLDDLIDKIKSINLEVIIAIGHTDAVGSDDYNLKLSMRRSNAVKAYLVSKGVDKTRIYTEGKGESQPVADNKTKEGRAKNRRVEIEVVGARKN